MNDFRRNVLGKNMRGDKRYVRWLQRVVNDLEAYGTDVMEMAPRFEWLTDADGICSARYPRSQKNPRILFFFFSQGRIVLLYPFLEKSRKDYDRAVEIAKQRKKAVVL